MHTPTCKHVYGAIRSDLDRASDVVFSDINAGDSEKKEELFPAVSLVFGRAEVTINLLTSTNVLVQSTLDDITHDVVATVFKDTIIEEPPSLPVQEKHRCEPSVKNIAKPPEDMSIEEDKTVRVQSLNISV